MLYFNCLGSWGKKFMKFGGKDWKKITFKVGKKRSFEHQPTILEDFDHHL